MIKNWLKIAFKNYRKNGLATFISVLGISVGLSIFLLTFLHWLDENTYEQWVPDKENIYLLENKVEGFGYLSSSSFPALHVSKDKFDEIEEYAIINYWSDFQQRLNHGENASFTSSGFATSSFFEFFRFDIIAGNPRNALDDLGQIALSVETAKMLFGDDYKKSIGKTVIKDNDQKSFVVSLIYDFGDRKTVFKPGFLTRNPDFDGNNNHWTNYSFIGFFKLKPGTNLKNLEQKLKKQQNEQEKIAFAKWGESIKDEYLSQVFLTRVDKIKLHAKGKGVDKADKKNLLILLTLAGLILLLSAINLINLKTAQSAQRAKEVGVKKAIGSNKSQLILQFLFETFILCFISLLLAFMLVEFSLPFFNQYLGKEITLPYTQLAMYSVVFLIILTLISGLIPAIYLAEFKPIETLKGNFSRSSHGIWLRNGILTLQLIISSFFIISSIIIQQQVQHMMNKDLGFDGDQVIHVYFKKNNWKDENYNVRKYERLRDEVGKIKGVKDITGSLLTMGNGLANSASVRSVQDTTNEIMGVGVGAIELNFFDFYDIEFIAGKNMDVRFASNTISGTVINEKLANDLGWNAQDAIGKEINPGWNEEINYKVLGVVKDFHFSGVNNELNPVAFFNYDRNWTKNSMQNLQIKLDQKDIPNTLKRIEDFFTTKAEPGYPFDYYFLDKHFAKTFEKYQKQRTLFVILNAVVLIVALLGLFALSALLIEQKLKTVAIKKTLGASDGTLIFGLTKQFLIITAIAVLISIPISYYFMNEWLKDFAYRIEMPWWPYVLSLLLLLVLTFVVVSFKAYRATKISLVKYLKYE